MKYFSSFLGRKALIFRAFILTALLGIAPFSSVFAQDIPCPPNVDFENGDFTNWECYTGSVSGSPPSSATFPVYYGNVLSGPIGGTPPIPGATYPYITGRHNVVSGTDVDPYGGFPIVNPGGGTYSMILGNDNTGAQAERVKYYVHVPVGFNQYSFNFQYAAVLENPNHQANIQPAFVISAYDSATGQPLPCAEQAYTADSSLIGFGFKLVPTTKARTNPTYYLPWTGGALPLIGQGGKTIVIEVTSYDCGAGGHFGYGYFDVLSCGKYKAATTYCNLDSGVVRFIGTGITQTYNWYSSNWTFMGKGAYIDIKVPATPDFFYGVLDGGTPGCLDTIVTDTISNFFLTTTDSACVKFGTPIQLSTAPIGGGIGPFSYNWTPNGELSCLKCDNPVASPISPTEYYVKVADRIGCFRTDTVHIFQAPDAGPDRKVCPLGDRPAKLHVAGPSTANYTWYTDNGQLADFITPNPGQDVWAAPLTPVTNVYVYSDVCQMYDTLVINHDLTNWVETPQNTLIVCRPTYMQLLSEGKGPSPKLNVPCGGNNPITCLTETTVVAGYGTIPASTRMNNPFYAQNKYHKYQFIIPKQELLDAGFYSGTINSLDLFDMSQGYVGTMPDFTISLACVPNDYFDDPPTNKSFFTTPQLVYTGSNYVRTPNAWNKFVLDQPYSWDTSTNLLVDICYERTAADPNDTAGFAMVPGTAIQRDDNLINVCGGDAKKVYGFIQRPSVQISFCETPDLPFQYTWRPGTFLQDSTVQNPNAYVSKSMDYTVYTKGKNGCLLKAPLNIIMPIHDLGIRPNDSTACRNQPVPMFATGADAYQWYEVQGGVFTDASGSLSCTNCSNPIATPAQTTRYAVVYTNDVDRGNPNNPGSSLGCPDTLYTTLNIDQLPPVVCTNLDTTIKFGTSLQLFAKGASNFTWTPVGSLDDPNSPAPIAKPKETTYYIVSGVDSNGCIARDTVKVTVDYTNTMMIPSGFTPNGDGRNDVFKVVNPSFQRLTEFRVFNRWGQEVFSTNDINKGWDGKWKGVDQPIGTYQYLIRLANVDGKAEVYKGDVTLVR
ncbi:MAG: gliding motility-associated C-terminal domain-containing protein [Bacteroidetes bacterium]|nr:gliding motility-associated C-terminal domain-containing protein [Bacteroidota bacterium]